MRKKFIYFIFLPKLYINYIELNNSSEVRGLLDYDRVRSESLMKSLDKINYRYGRSTLRLASEGLEKNWQMRRSNISPSYTTSFEEILKVNCK